MRRSAFAAIYGAILLIVTACSTENPTTVSTSSLAGKLVITGSSTVAPLVQELAQKFESLHPKVRIDVQTGGSGRGISDTLSGRADIGMASRALKKGELNLIPHNIAADGVAVILHKDNPIESLSRKQIKQIYTGQISNWIQVNGMDSPITVVHKAEGRATQEVFLSHFSLKNPDIKADIIVGHNEQGILSVSQNPNAIAYVSIGTAEADSKAGIAIKLLPLDGIDANTQQVASGAFPMSRPLNLLTRKNPSDLAQAFIQFSKSKTVHDIISAQHFAPIQK